MEGQGESKEDAIDGGNVSCVEYKLLLFYFHLFSLTQKEIKQTHPSPPSPDELNGGVKQPPKKKRRKRAKFSRNLRTKKDRKNSQTFRNYNDGVDFGLVPEIRDVVARATMRWAARKLTKSVLTQALKAMDEDRASLLDHCDKKEKRVESLRGKNKDLADATNTARASSKESKRRMVVVEKEKELLEKELEDMRDCYEADLVTAIRALEEKKKVSPLPISPTRPVISGAILPRTPLLMCPFTVACYHRANERDCRCVGQKARQGSAPYPPGVSGNQEIIS